MTVVQARGAAAAGVASTVRGERVMRRFGRVLIPGDGLAALVAILVAMLSPRGVDRGAEALLFVPLWVSAVAMSGEYRNPGTIATRGRRLAFVALGLPTAVLLGAELISYPLAARTVTVVCVLSAALGLLGRVVVVAATRRGFRVSDVTHRVVVAGTGAVLPAVRARLEEERRHRFQVVGACVAAGDPPDLEDVVVVPDLGRCAEAVERCGADAVILAPDPAIAPRDVLRLRWELEEAGVRIFVWTGLLAAPAGRTTLDLTDDLALLHLCAPRRLGTSHLVKRAIDRLLAVAALLLLLPLFVGVAVAIRLDSPGPAFFRQIRVGRGDSVFTMWKFRTMRCDAEAVLTELAEANQASGLLFKVHRDPRITRIGGWLRRTSLDELPQLLNVVLGHMSLVGPRPALPSEVELYPPDVRHRLVVEPGMTGLWQVSGRSDLPWEEAIRLDQEYVDSWSLLLDLRIMVRTVRAVVRGKGAY